MKAPLPPNELQRLAALYNLDILDTPADVHFEEVVALAAEICEVPMAAITLVDQGRQWFKAQLGLGCSETTREAAFCAHALERTDMLVVPDALLDVRFADNPLVLGEPAIRFYAGTPLVTPDGLTMGTLCVIDRVPRELTEKQERALQVLGRDVMTQLMLRRQVREEQEKSLQLQEAVQARLLSEGRVRTIVDTAHDAFISIDALGFITDWNRQAEVVFGWSRLEAIGHPMSEKIIPPQYRESHHRGMKHFLSSGEGPVLNRRIELSGLRRDGSEFPLEITITPIQQAGGVFFAAFLRDISLRKSEEAKLLESEEKFRLLSEELELRVESRTQELGQSEQRYRFLADSVPQIVWTNSPNGNVDYFNQRWFDYTGMTMEQTKDWGWTPVIHPDDLPNCVEHWTHSLKTGENYEVEYRFKRGSDGAYRWHLGRGFPMRKDGEIISWVGTCTDIDDYKKIEEALRESQTGLEQKVEERTMELARSNRELEHFAYVASHDLQEPLRMVASFTQLLRERYHDQLDAEAHEFIDFAVDGAKRMKLLIEGLLNYSRIGRAKRQFARMHSGQALDDAIANLQIAIADSGATITRDPLPEVLGDMTLLTQLLQNLMVNAMKFRSAEPLEIHISAQLEEEMWRFSIQDNGIGIDPRHAERIFVIFQRLHSAARYPGTGIGLAVCKKIAEYHGGDIGVRSQTGAGACFWFTLPARHS